MRGKNEGVRTIYLRVADGKIVETVDAGTEGAVERTTKSGKVVHERLDDYVDGTITAMFMRSHEYNGKELHELCIRLQDVDEYYQLSLQVGNRYWVAFAMRLPNLDLSKPMRFCPYHFIPKGENKPISGMNIFQNNNKIAPKWSKTEPGDLPQGKQEVAGVNGETRWNFMERDIFLHKIVTEYIDQMKTGDQAMGGVDGENGDEYSDLPWDVNSGK